MNNDRDFLKKVYRSVLFLWVVAMIWCMMLQVPWIALSITLGTLLDTGILLSLHWIVPRLFTPGATKKPNRILTAFGLLKYVIIGTALYWLVRWHNINLPAFCGGVMLVHLAIFAKMAGIRMVDRRRTDKP